MPRLSVRQLFDDRRQRLGLSWAAGESGGEREFTGEMLRKPGVGLIGHLNLIHPLLAQVLGRREVDYIEKLAPFGLKVPRWYPAALERMKWIAHTAAMFAFAAWPL